MAESFRLYSIWFKMLTGASTASPFFARSLWNLAHLSGYLRGLEVGWRWKEAQDGETSQLQYTFKELGARTSKEHITGKVCRNSNTAVSISLPGRSTKRPTPKQLTPAASGHPARKLRRAEKLAIDSSRPPLLPAITSDRTASTCSASPRTYRSKSIVAIDKAVGVPKKKKRLETGGFPTFFTLRPAKKTCTQTTTPQLDISPC